MYRSLFQAWGFSPCPQGVSSLAGELMVWLGGYALNICTKNSLHSGSVMQRRSSVCHRMVCDGT